MNITLDKNEMKELELQAIQKAARKAAYHDNITTQEFLRLHRCTAISYYNGLFTVEFSRVSRTGDSMIASTKALPLHLR